MSPPRTTAPEHPSCSAWVTGKGRSPDFRVIAFPPPSRSRHALSVAFWKKAQRLQLRGQLRNGRFPASPHSLFIRPKAKPVPGGKLSARKQVVNYRIGHHDYGADPAGWNHEAKSIRRWAARKPHLLQELRRVSRCMGRIAEPVRTAGGQDRIFSLDKGRFRRVD